MTEDGRDMKMTPGDESHAGRSAPEIGIPDQEQVGYAAADDSVSEAVESEEKIGAKDIPDIKSSKLQQGANGGRR